MKSIKKYFLLLPFIIILFSTSSFGADPAMKAITGVTSTNITTLCAVGEKEDLTQGTILISNDFGEHWTKIDTSTIPNFNTPLYNTDLYATLIVGNKLWVAGNYNQSLNTKAFYSNDWGASWTDASSGLTANCAMGIALDELSPDHGVIAESTGTRGSFTNGAIFYSTNASGGNWESVSFNPAPIYGIASSKVSNNFWVVGQIDSSVGIYKSINGGISWNPVSATLTDPKVTLKDICFVDPAHGFITGSNFMGTSLENYLLYTQDGGATPWKSAIYGSKNNGVYFINSTTGWLCTDNGFVVKLSGNDPASFAVVPQLLLKVYPTRASGTISQTTSPLNRVFALDENNVFTVCDDGGIYAIISPFTITSVVQSGTTINQAYVGFDGYLTITGTNFQIGNSGNYWNGSVSFPGSGIIVDNVIRNDSSHLTAKVTVVPPPSPPSPDPGFDLVVTNIDGTTATSSFVVTPKPTVTSITPPSGAQGTTHTLTVIGTDFQPGITAAFSGTGITITDPIIVNPTELSLNITIASNAPLGPQTVTFTNLDGGKDDSKTFTVTPKPTITSISPLSGALGKTLDVTVYGSDFQPGITADFGAGIATNSVTYVSHSELTVNITISANPGAHTISVTNHPDGGTGYYSSFTVNPLPTVTSITPSYGSQGVTGLDLIVIGSGFQPGIISFFGTDTSNVIIYQSPIKLIIRININADALIGMRSVYFINPDGGTVAKSFKVLSSPTITSIVPSSGAQGTSRTLTVAGNNFLSGITANFNTGTNTGITNTIISQGPNKLIIDITISPSATLGIRPVTFTNPDGGSISSDFTVNPSPRVDSITPPSGIQGTTNLNLTVLGDYFQHGITADFGLKIITNSVLWQSVHQLTINISIAPDAATVARTVTFTNPDLGSNSRQSFTVSSATAKNPIINSVSPNSVAQGTNNKDLTVSGSNFEDGASTTFSDSGITVNSTTWNSSTRLTVNISVASDAPTTARSITVSNPQPPAGTGGAGSLNPALNITTQGVTNPTVTSCDPSTIYRGTTRLVHIYGTGFKEGAQVSLSPASSDIVITNVNVISPAEINLTLTISNSAVLGFKSITVTNLVDGGHGTLDNAIEVLAQADVPEVTNAICNPNLYNPSAGQTTIQFFIDKDAVVEINLINISGYQRKAFVINAIKGYNQLFWNGKDASGEIVGNGVYIGLIKADGKIQKEKFKIMVQNK